MTFRKRKFYHLPVGHPDNPKTYPICGAKKRRKDTPCLKSAGYKTDHVGVGRCFYHGGASIPGTHIKHGMRSVALQNKLRAAYIDKVERESIDIGADPIDLRAELAVQRDLLSLFLYRHARAVGLELPGALLESGEQILETLPAVDKGAIDLQEFIKIVYNMTHEIGVTTDKISTQRKDAVMSLQEIQRQAQRLQAALMLTLEEFIPDANVRQAALERFVDRSGTRLLAEPEPTPVD